MSGAEAGAAEWSLGGEGLCVTRSNVLQPRVTVAELPTRKHLVPCPAELDIERGRWEFIKCLSLDMVFDNTVWLCFSGADAAAARDSSACMSARLVLLSFKCHQ